MEVNEVMLIVAEEVARELGYIDAGKEVIEGKNSSFWGNREFAADKQVKSCLYILPQWEGESDEKKRSQKLKLICFGADLDWVLIIRTVLFAASRTRMGRYQRRKPSVRTAFRGLSKSNRELTNLLINNI